MGQWERLASARDLPRTALLGGACLPLREQACTATYTELSFTSMLQLQANHWSGLLPETDSAARRQISGAAGGTACTQLSTAALCVLQWLHPYVHVQQPNVPAVQPFTFEIVHAPHCIAWPAAVSVSSIPSPCGSPSHAPTACHVAMGHWGPNHRQQDVGQLHLWRSSCHSCLRHHKSPGRWPWLSCLTWGLQAEPTSTLGGHVRAGMPWLRLNAVCSLSRLGRLPTYWLMFWFLLVATLDAAPTALVKCPAFWVQGNGPAGGACHSPHCTCCLKKVPAGALNAACLLVLCRPILNLVNPDGCRAGTLA